MSYVLFTPSVTVGRNVIYFRFVSEALCRWKLAISHIPFKAVLSEVACHKANTKHNLTHLLRITNKKHSTSIWMKKHATQMEWTLLNDKNHRTMQVKMPRDRKLISKDFTTQMSSIVTFTRQTWWGGEWTGHMHYFFTVKSQNHTS